ncbi:MAG: hypothetical protein JSW58_04040 [Candidatus Latescibacterota bacterium]|nr:MAG: hypothetical protein JSW58_04040 [Candidatus Latescibacterota bacterium]
MNALRKTKYLVLVMFAVWMFGCGDDTTKPPPPPAPPAVDMRMVSGLPDIDVYNVFVDSQGRTWFSTEQGLAMAESDPTIVDSVYNDFDGIPNRKCRGVAELNGKIFVGTWGNGIGFADDTAIYDANTPWSQLTVDDGLISGRVYDIAVDDTSLWVATVAGITQYVDNEALEMEDRWIDHTDDTGTGVVTSILFQVTPTRGPEVWFSEVIRDSLGVLLPGGVKFLGFPGFQHFTTASSGIPSDDVNQVVYDPLNDLFWSAHVSNGIASVDVDSRVWSQMTMEDGLVSDLVTSIGINHLDDEWPAGTMWVGTPAGLSRIKPNGNISNYIKGSGMPTEQVRKIYVDRFDHVWVVFVENSVAMVRGGE